MKNLLNFIWTTFTGNFISPDGYFFWGWVVLYIGVAIYLSYLEQRPFSWRNALKNCFPRRTFLGASAKLDYKFFIAGLFILYPLTFFVLDYKNLASDSIATHVSRGLSSIGPLPIPISNGFWIDAGFTFLLLLIADLGWTVQHIAFHRIPWLWEFHKVHHSATELNLFTVARLHPFEVLIQSWVIMICAATFAGLCKVFLGYMPSVLLVANVSWAMVLYRIIGIYRHSHLWITFPNFLSKLVCSPAMHQVHHSIEKKHHDKNFCNVFSFWDWVFGTLYIPKEKENLVYGIETNDSPYRKYNSFWASLLHPFIPDKLLIRFYQRKNRYLH